MIDQTERNRDPGELYRGYPVLTIKTLQQQLTLPWSLPHWYLLVQSQQLKHNNYARNLLKVNNKDTWMKSHDNVLSCTQISHMLQVSPMLLWNK